jgi:lipopolysaccharide biosynthesis glycosyltransferase
MENLLIISVFNYGAIEIATNHLKSLQNQGIDNYMAYVTDQESLDQLQEKGYHVTLFPMEEAAKSAHTPLSKEKENFGSKSFDDITYIRYLIIAKLLREGKTVWYLDVDTVVLSNIRRLVSLETRGPEKPSYDMMLQNDINMGCSGCMLCFPTAMTIHIIENVHMYRNAGFNDQILLNKVLRKYMEQNQCKIAYLQTNIFPNGLLYFHALHTNPHF